VIRSGLGGVMIAAGLAFGAAAADFHQIFEQRCAGCHGHAGAFVRDTVTVVDGVLTGVRSGRAVASSLATHYGGLDPSEIKLFVRVFTRQASSGAFFQERCAICHDRAYELARLRLILRDGQLTGRYSGRDMAAFLPGHARMTPEEAEQMLDALTRLRQGER
jgi:hypothetical protein